MIGAHQNILVQYQQAVCSLFHFDDFLDVLIVNIVYKQSPFIVVECRTDKMRIAERGNSFQFIDFLVNILNVGPK